MTRNEAERQRVEEAIQRLLHGSPRLSNGDHTIVALAIESDVKRVRLYEQYQDLINDFKKRARQTTFSKHSVAAHRELVETRNLADKLANENHQLRDRIRTLSAIIAELSIHETNAHVIPFRR